MSWVTVAWSMIASACLTLAAIYALVWWRHRAARAQLLFAVTAVSTAALALCELRLMQAATPREALAVLAWAHVPLFFCLVSAAWFVRVYLNAGRTWLAWTLTGLRALAMLLNVALGQDVAFRQLTSLRQVEFLGETVNVLSGVPNRATPIAQLATLLVLVFVADAAVTAWRRGDRRKALMVGGSVEFFLVASLGTASAILWGNVEMPILFSLFYLGLVAVMGHELSRDMIRAAELVGELQRSNQQISDLFGRVIAAQETERSRIARDLHDDVSQRIAGLSIMISRLRSRLRGQPGESEVLVALSAMQQHTISVSEEIRHLSHDLHPSLLQHAGLINALAVCCAEFESLHAIPVTFSAGEDVGKVDAETELCLYRVAQEAMRNAAKHAQAARIVVALTRSPSAVQLLVSDDGKGFDLATMRGKGIGLGLVSIDERVRFLRGSVRIETPPRGGTSVLVQIPAV